MARTHPPPASGGIGAGLDRCRAERRVHPDAAMGGLKRAPGKWHPFIHLVTLSALPIVYAYNGLVAVTEHLLERQAEAGDS